MAFDTPFTRLVGCRLPLQQAGMGGTAGPALAAAVAGAGAVGMLGLAGMAPVAAVDAAREATRADGVVGANFLVPFLDRAAVEAVAPLVRLVEFFYGDPDPAAVELVHDAGALAAWQVGSVDEARAGVDAGCDFVVAQGVEAGGHVRGVTGLLPLLDLVLDAVEVPVVAAGGLGSGRAVAAVLAAGAAAARVGTRFVAAEEADAHPAYVDALIAAGPEDTVLTTTFSTLWPDAPHRVLRDCIEQAALCADEFVATIEGGDGSVLPVPRLAPPSPQRGARGNIAAMAHYAGQSVGEVRRRQPAAAIVEELMGPARRLLEASR
jgi:NAD(P)H-dependent flavin oxidoreductase YrpB (nitropropane dioxygenase family)